MSQILWLDIIIEDVLTSYFQEGDFFYFIFIFYDRANFFLSYCIFMYRTFSLGGLKGSNASLLVPGTIGSNKTASSHKRRN